MGISKFIKKLFIVFIALLIGNIGLLADANQLKTIQHKQKVTHEKIKRLKVLEHLKKINFIKTSKDLNRHQILYSIPKISIRH